MPGGTPGIQCRDSEEDAAASRWAQGCERCQRSASGTPSKRLPAYSLEASTPLHGGKLVRQRDVQQPRTSSTSASPGQTPAGSDPYMASPSTTARRSSPAAGHRRRIATPDGTAREGVKAAVKPAAPKHTVNRSQSRRQIGGKTQGLDSWESGCSDPGGTECGPGGDKSCWIASAPSPLRRRRREGALRILRLGGLVQLQIRYPGPPSFGVALPICVSGTQGSGIGPWMSCSHMGMLLCMLGPEELRQFEEWAAFCCPCDKSGAVGCSLVPRLADGQRGGWVSGAARLTDPSHVPTEPSSSPWLQQSKQVFSWAQFLFCAGGRRRGGWVSGAFGRTDPSHVPTEPPQYFDFWCRVAGLDVGLGQWHKHVVLFLPDGNFDCMDFYGRPSKLTVSVRQPVWLWKLSNHGDSLLFGYEQTGFFVGVTARTLSWSIPRVHVVFPPCWYGGLLNTPWVQFTDGLMPGLMPVYRGLHISAAVLFWLFPLPQLFVPLLGTQSLNFIGAVATMQISCSFRQAGPHSRAQVL